MTTNLPLSELEFYTMNERPYSKCTAFMGIQSYVALNLLTSIDIHWIVIKQMNILRILNFSPFRKHTFEFIIGWENYFITVMTSHFIKHSYFITSYTSNGIFQSMTSIILSFCSKKRGNFFSLKCKKKKAFVTFSNGSFCSLTTAILVFVLKINCC